MRSTSQSCRQSLRDRESSFRGRVSSRGPGGQVQLNMKTNTLKTNETTPESAAIDRLRHSKKELEVELRSNGKAAGQQFVLKDACADAACLSRLERADSLGTELGSFHALATLLCGDNGTESDWQEQFQEKFGYEIEEPEWIEGFVEGALEKFHEIEEKL